MIIFEETRLFNDEIHLFVFETVLNNFWKNIHLYHWKQRKTIIFCRTKRWCPIFQTLFCDLESKKIKVKKWNLKANSWTSGPNSILNWNCSADTSFWHVPIICAILKILTVLTEDSSSIGYCAQKRVLGYISGIKRVRRVAAQW